MRKGIILIAALIAVLILGGCGGGDAKDVPVADIETAVDTALGTNVDMAQQSESYVKGMLKIEPGSYAECVVKSDAHAETVDEYGIFKGADSSQTDKLETSVKAYLDVRRASWMDAYMPEEKPKVENAEYKRVGNYVMYVILHEDNRATALKAFEDALK